MGTRLVTLPIGIMSGYSDYIVDANTIEHMCIYRDRTKGHYYWAIKMKPPNSQDLLKGIEYETLKKVLEYQPIIQEIIMDTL